MAAHNLESVQRIATLVEITVPGLGVKRYQNWCREDYWFMGEPYGWLDFDGAAISSRALDFGNSETTVEIGNRSARVDSLRPLREWMRSYDGWRRARVQFWTTWPDDPAAPAIENRLQVLSSDLQAGRVSFRLRDPIEAINAAVPSAHATRQNAPELPHLAATQGF